MAAKTIMILGASHYQCPLIASAKSRGYRTIVCSIRGSYPGIDLADVFVEVDITSPWSVLAATQEYDVDGVVTASTDLTVMSLGVLNTARGLRGVSRFTATTVSNKLAMKCAFLEHEVPTPAAEFHSNLEELSAAIVGMSFPRLLKRAYGMGSSGVWVLRAADSLSEVVRTWKLPSDEPLLTEAFVRGVEFGAQALVQDRRLKYLLPHNDTVISGDRPTPVGHSFPFRAEAPATLDQIEQATLKVIEAIRATDTHLNLDFILTADGVACLEVGPRLGATGLPDCASYFAGRDVYADAIDVSLGVEVNASSQLARPVASRYVWSESSGRVKSFSLPGPGEYGLVKSQEFVKPGDAVRAFREGRDRIGELIVSGHTLDDAEKNLDAAIRSVQLELEP